MIDLRPVGYVVGITIAALGAAMLVPMLADLQAGSSSWRAFLQSALATLTCGGLIALSCQGGSAPGVSPRLALVLAAAVFGLVPLFGALPFVLGAPRMGLLDAYFDAVSGITTTGSTQLTALETLPAGIQLWRGMLGWFGGLAFVALALIFQPQMRVGGMSFFRAVTRDGSGRILPRVVTSARQLALLYGVLTALCALTYLGLGMVPLDAAVHAMATLSGSGVSTSDQNFGGLSPALHLAAVLFMLLASLPYVRLAQALNRHPGALTRDPQVRAYLLWVLLALVLVLAYRLATIGPDGRAPLVLALFNVVSAFSGTGFRSGDFASWGPFVLMVVVVVGILGGCTGSTSSGLGMFRVLMLRSVIRAQVARIQLPHRVAPVRYDDRAVDDEVIDQVLLYVGGYFAALIGLSILLSMTGIPSARAVLMVWSSLGNIGGFFGPGLAPGAAMADLTPAAKLLLILAMVVGRLGLTGVLMLLSRRFWRD